MMKKILPLGILVLLTLTAVASKENKLEDRLKEHVKILASDSLQGRGLGTIGAEKARQYITTQFKEAGIKPLQGNENYYLQPFSFRQQLAWISGYNIVGVIEGSDPVLKNEYIVIGAHYDHLGYEGAGDNPKLFPGADDNASGVAAIIEVGRYFSLNRNKLKRSLIVIAFDGEESGLMGSRFFVNNSIVPLEDIKMMFSFDMVGMLSANEGLLLKGISSVEVAGILAENLAQEHEINLKNTSDKTERRTDTAPFGQRGIPAVHVFTGTKSPYHKPGDSFEKLDYRGMARIHGLMTNLIAELSTLEQITPEGKMEVTSGEFADNTGFSWGYTMLLGSGFHQYKDEFYRANSSFSGGAGLYMNLPAGKLFSLQPELLYDINGSKIEGGNFWRHSLIAPLNLQFGTPRTGEGGARVFYFVGPYYRYSFGGKIADTAIDYNVFEQQEWGYSMGFGFEIMRFTIGYTHRSALTSIVKDEQRTIYNINSYLSIYYRF